jgi:hypothetical protein
VRVGATPDLYVNCLLDELYIFDCAITEAEIKELAGINLEEGLIAYYPFNGNANDESGNGNHGTEYGGVS